MIARRVFVLERLTDDDISTIITRAIQRVSSTAGPTADAEEIPDERATDPHSDGVAAAEASSSQISACSTSTVSNEVLFPAYPHMTQQVLSSIISLSTGDARTALSLVELALSAAPNTPTSTLLDSLRRSVSSSYDRTGDSHYDMISALHKCVRGSQGGAAMYWLARMLSAGEDPVYIARRMVVCASEDIGLADNHALPLVGLRLRLRLVVI